VEEITQISKSTNRLRQITTNQFHPLPSITAIQVLPVGKAAVPGGAFAPQESLVIIRPPLNQLDDVALRRTVTLDILLRSRQ
jgi:hypothetical protein